MSEIQIVEKVNGLLASATLYAGGTLWAQQQMIGVTSGLERIQMDFRGELKESELMRLSLEMDLYEGVMAQIERGQEGVWL